MGRLIDADLFSQKLINCNALGRKSFELVLNELNSEPTAYDIDYVVECLEDEQFEDYTEIEEIRDKAIEIVRNGGVE